MPSRTETARVSRDSDRVSGLAPREVELLAGWERERRVSVTLDDIRRLVKGEAAKRVASSLCRKGALDRVSRGIYLVRPFRSLVRPSSSSSVVAAAALLRSEPYYLGGLWAFTHHGLTEQQHASTIDAFVARRRSPVFRRPARLALHVVRTELLSYGIATVEVERMTVNVSDVERTLLDALDHPRLVGGMRRALDLFSTGLARADLNTLIGHAVRGSRHSTCQRVGVLLERRGARRSLLTRLERKVRERKTLLSMVPRAPRSGRISKRWNVVENDL